MLIPPYLEIWRSNMEDREKDHELAEHDEKLVSQIEKDIQYDENGRAFFPKEVILNLVFRVTDFMRFLSKRI